MVKNKMEEQKNKIRINWKIYLKVLIGILIFGIGILAGIQIGTYAVIDHITYGLSGSTFIVNFNETKLVDRVTENMKPIIWDIKMQNCTITEKGYCALECYENNELIPCSNFTNDEHFCEEGICSVAGICPTYYEKLRGKTIYDCITDAENKQKGGLNSSQP